MIFYLVFIKGLHETTDFLSFGPIWQIQVFCLQNREISYGFINGHYVIKYLVVENLAQDGVYAQLFRVSLNLSVGSSRQMEIQ